MIFKPNELDRYIRQTMIDGWGREGQTKLKEAKVFVAGAGGLGSPVIMYLAAAGIGTIRVCDYGRPEISNLNRQILHTESDFKLNKAISAAASISRINPHVNVEPLTDKITAENAVELISDSDLIIDCLDNFETRHHLNEIAVQKGIPFIHAGIHGLSGQVTFFHSPGTSCLRCIFPGTVSKRIFPAIGATAAIIGSIQCLEAIKWIVGIGTLLKNRLLIFEGDTMNFHEIAIQKDPHCPLCGK